MAPEPVSGALNPAQWQAAIVALIVIACSWWVQSGLAVLGEHRDERQRVLADFESLRRDVARQGSVGDGRSGKLLRDPCWSRLFKGLVPEVVQTHAGNLLILVSPEQDEGRR